MALDPITIIRSIRDYLASHSSAPAADQIEAISEVTQGFIDLAMSSLEESPNALDTLVLARAWPSLLGRHGDQVQALLDSYLQSVEEVLGRLEKGMVSGAIGEIVGNATSFNPEGGFRALPHKKENFKVLMAQYFPQETSPQPPIGLGTVIRRAAKKGDYDMVTFLLSALPAPVRHLYLYDRAAFSRRICLHYAAKSGKLDSLLKILNLLPESERFAVMKVSDRWGWIPMHYAVKHDYLTEVRGILESMSVQHGAQNVLTRNNDGRTPVHYAGPRVREYLFDFLPAGPMKSHLESEFGF